MPTVPGQGDPIRRRTVLLVAALLAVTTIVLYARTVRFEFTTFDDPDYVTANAEVQEGISARGVRWALTTGHASNWHPVTWLSHMTDVEAFGMHAGGHHATNVLLHAASTAMLFLFLVTSTRRLLPSAFAAAFFACHPLRVESVAWVSERKDVLSAAFGLASILCCGIGAKRGAEEGRITPGLYALSFFLFLLAVGSKPMMVTLPFVLLLLDYWPLERWRSGLGLRLIREKIPFLVAVVAVAAATYLVQRSGGAMRAGGTIEFSDRLANVPVGYVWYLTKTMLPTGLAPLYVHPSLPGGTPLLPWQVVSATLFLVGATWFVWRYRGAKYARVGVLWFLGTLVPVIGLVQVGGQATADRYSYFPSIGLSILFAWGGEQLLGMSVRCRGGRRTSWWTRLTVLVALSAVLTTCGAVTWHQIGYWQNSRTLYERAVSVEPRSPLMNNNLALILSEAGDLEEASRTFVGH